MTKTEIARAFAQRKPGRCRNAHTDGATYTLHKSPIAVHKDGAVVFFWHGYYTVTTASHMNELLHALNAPFRVSYAQARRDNAVGFVVEGTK